MVRSLDHGGCERDAAKIAIGLDRTRFEPHVAVFHQGGFRTPEVVAAGVDVVHVPVTSFGNTSTIRGARILGDYVRKHKIQLIHAFDVPTDLFGAPVARWYRVPRVITSQLSFRDMYPPRERAALRVADWLSDAVVVNSKAVGKSLEQEAKLSASKIYLSYNGVNTEHFHPGPANRPEAFRDASVIVGSVCVMRWEKRMDWVLRSFAEVFKEDAESATASCRERSGSRALDEVARQSGTDGRLHVRTGPGRSRGLDANARHLHQQLFVRELPERTTRGDGLRLLPYRVERRRHTGTDHAYAGRPHLRFQETGGTDRDDANGRTWTRDSALGFVNRRL